MSSAIEGNICEVFRITSSSTWVYFDRAAGRDCDHCHLDRPSLARRATGAGSRLLDSMQEQRQTAGLALDNYHDTFLTFLPVASPARPSVRYQGWGWNTMILPYMDQAPLYNQFNFSNTMLATITAQPTVINPDWRAALSVRCRNEHRQLCRRCGGRRPSIRKPGESIRPLQLPGSGRMEHHASESHRIGCRDPAGDGHLSWNLRGQFQSEYRRYDRRLVQCHRGG